MKKSISRSVTSLLKISTDKDENDLKKLQKELKDLKKKYEELEAGVREKKEAGNETVSAIRSEKLIEALNAANLAVQKVHTKKEIFEAVSGELKKLEIDSLVMTASNDITELYFKYYSYDTKLIRIAEKLAKMTVGELKLTIQGVKEYEDVMLYKKSLLVQNSVDFVKRILPGKLKFLAGQLTKMFKISRFILSPLIIENKVIGIFSVQSDDLVESDIPEVKIFAHQLAGAWHKSELLENANVEISERKRAEEKLKESTRKINTLINNIPGVVYRCLDDKDWTMEYISEGIERLSGYPASDFIGNRVRTYNSIIVSEDTDSVWEEIQKGIKENNPFTLEYKIKTSDGRIRTVWERGVGIYDNDKLVALEGYIADITEKKKTEEENLLLARTVKSVRDSISITDMNNNLIFLNDAFLETYGYKEGELQGKNISVISPDLTEGMTEGIRTGTIKGGWHGELINERKDGSRFPIELWTSVVKDVNGNVIAEVGVARDITERKLAEEELSRSEKRFSLFFSQSLDGYYYTQFDEPVLWNEDADKEKILTYANTNQRIVEINDAMLEQYGTTREVLLGKPVSIFFEHETEYGRNMRRKLFDEGRLHVETKERKFDGTEIWIEGDYVCLFDEQNRITGTFGIQRDITKRKKAEEEIRAYTEKIEGIFKVAPAGIGIVKDRVFTEANPRICEMTGYTREDLIGKSSLILYPSQEDYDFVGKEKYRQIEMKGLGYVETKWKKKSGEIINIFLASTPLDSNDLKKGVIFTALDITGHTQAKEALARSEAKYKALFQNSALAIGIRKTDGTYIEFNEAYSKMLGYSFEELKLLSQKDITHPEDISITRNYMSLISEGKGEIKKYEKRYIHKNGNIIWGEVCIQPLYKKDGQIEAVIGTVVDITKRKIAEMNLRKSESAFEKQRDAIAALATNEILAAGDILNSKMILAKTATDVLNVERASIWILSEDKSKLECIELYERSKLTHSSGMVLDARDYPNYFEALKTNSQISVMDAQNDIKTGEFKNHYLVPLGITSMLDSVLLSKDGIIGVFCFEHIGNKRAWYPSEESFANTMASLFVKCLAIDEAKKAEKHISMLANALESVNESVSITDTNNNIIYVNKAFTAAYGYNEDEIIGKNIILLGSDKNPYGIHDKIHSSVTKGLWQGELINTKKDGTEFPIYLSSAPILDKKGKTIAYIGVANDITKNKQAEEALRSAKDKAEEMNRIKTSFLANMSHEVRTPLVAILGFSELLSDMVTEPEVKNFVDMIHAGGVRLLDTLNLILDLSIIESQKMNILFKEVDIAKEIRDTAALFEKYAAKKKLKLSVKSEYNSLIFNSDEKIIRQVLNNLINNGIKYTSNGSVTIYLQKEKREDKSYICIRVEDTGIGIPKEKQDLIWDEFRQVSEGFNRSFEGTGLGLSITKKFVEKLGGEIYLEKSDLDIGSVFKVLFPAGEKTFEEGIINAEDKKMNSKPGKTGTDKLPVLLYIDDDSISLDIVTAFTKNLYLVETAVSGREGIEKCKSRVYDAVLMDINLGKDIDGLQATAIIREIQEYKNIPIVAVTAFAMVGDKENFFKKGCTHYLSKPFNKIDLLELLEEVMKSKK